MRVSRLFPLLAAAIVVATPARADILIRVDKAAQIMTVDVDGAQMYAWPVSTGIASYDTPAGEYKPFRMERDHFSREWDDAPMPHSIFFTQEGHAIHGSYHVKNLGRPASHGCVRLEPKNAAILFALIRQQKMANTRVVLVGDIPGGGGAPMARRDGAIYADEDTGANPRKRNARGWSDNDYGAPRSFYNREQPYYAPRRNYGGFFPFGR
jgi:L,D-transpeptidase catalytic domain